MRIETGEDIAHLTELDPKMWTVLSCPVKGLEISDKSLAYVDVDADGKIRINDVVATSKWLTGVLKDNNLILKGSDSVFGALCVKHNRNGKLQLFSDLFDKVYLIKMLFVGTVRKVQSCNVHTCKAKS